MMNKLIVIFIVLLIVIGGALYYYHQVLPDKLSDAIVEERLPNYIPKEYKEKAYQLKDEIQGRKSEIKRQLSEKNVSEEELVEFVEKVEYDDVQQLIENADDVDLDSAELAFQYIKDNFDFGDFPIDSFKNDFMNYYSKEDFERLKKYYDENKGKMPMLFPVLKKSLSKFLSENNDSTYIEIEETP